MLWKERRAMKLTMSQVLKVLVCRVASMLQTDGVTDVGGDMEAMVVVDLIGMMNREEVKKTINKITEIEDHPVVVHTGDAVEEEDHHSSGEEDQDGHRSMMVIMRWMEGMMVTIVAVVHP